MKTGIILVGLLFLVSCNEIKGSFTAYQSLSFNGEEQAVTIDEGVYRATLGIDYDDNELTFDLKDVDQDIIFTISEDRSIPRHDSITFIPDYETNQPFDLRITIRSDVSYSDSYDRIETCYYSSPELVCRIIHGRQVCRTEYVQRRGFRNVRYHYKYEGKRSQFDMLIPNNEQIVAKFFASEKDTTKVIEYWGPCLRY